MSQTRLALMSGRLLRKVLPDAEVDACSRTSFEDLYAAAFPRVYAFVRYQVASTETAQEIVSRVFLKAYQYRDRLPPGDAAMHWVFRVANTTLIDYRRVEGRRERVNVPVDALAELASVGATPEAEYQRRQQLSDLLQVLGDLRDEDRQILALKFAGDRTNRDIAAILDLSPAAVSMRLLRALRGLRERLKSIGWNESN